MGKDYSIYQYLVAGFNVLFMLGGLGIVGIGVWIVVDGNSFSNFISSGDTSIFDYAAYTAIALGSLVALISFCGCCGALTENKCLLGLFIGCVSFFIVCEIAIAVLAFFFAANLKTILETPATTLLKESYGILQPVTDAYDGIQQDHKCCGFNGGKDYDNSRFKDIKTTAGTTTQNSWPASCCMNKDSPTDCVDRSPALNSYDQNGCFDALKSVIGQYGKIAGGVSIAVVCVQILAVIFACCVCCSAGKTKPTVRPWG